MAQQPDGAHEVYFEFTAIGSVGAGEPSVRLR